MSTAGINAARFETSPAGYLNEPQATNLLLQSNNLATGAWTRSNLAITTSGTAPNGVASSANLATENANLSTHYVSTGIGFVTTASTTYVVSAFIKAGTQRYVSVRGDASGLIATYPWITLDTTLGTIDANALALTPTVRAVSNGFYLVSFTFVAFGSGSGKIVFAGSNVSTAPVAASVNGASYTGTSLTWSAWGAMLAACLSGKPYSPKP